MHLSVSDQVKAKYDKQYSDSILPWRDIGGLYKAEHVMKLCREAGLAPKRILEVGAGEGSILYHLNKAGFGEELHAVEISQTGVNYINARNLSTIGSVQVFDGYTVPHEDKSFDLVILSHVLEHVEWERQTLRELRRLSDHHVIEVPLDFGADVDDRAHVYLGYGHINIYNPALLRFLLKSEGLEPMGEILDIMGEEVFKFKTFVMDKMPDTPENREKIDNQLRAAREKFESRKGREREMYAKDMAVLTRDTGEKLSIF